MDGFGDDLVENEVDPAADFLAREQNDLAGLEDELNPVGGLVNGIEPDVPIGDLETVGSENPDALITEVMASSPVPSQPREKRDEAEKITKWREGQIKLLEDKDKLEEKKKEEWRVAAKKELEEWYKHHEELVTKTRASNREAAKNAEKQFVAEEGEIEPGTEWERIAKLCDFNKKGAHINKDTTRMRSIILQLKQSPVLLKKIPES